RTGLMTSSPAELGGIPRSLPRCAYATCWPQTEPCTAAGSTSRYPPLGTTRFSWMLL
ncbi:hypothetical protein O3G_MSEX012715, partial [Manduca sexta]